MKNLENYGVQEMNAKEMKKTDGGGLLWFLAGAVAGSLFMEVLTDGLDQCMEDFMTGFSTPSA